MTERCHSDLGGVVALDDFMPRGSKMLSRYTSGRDLPVIFAMATPSNRKPAFAYAGLVQGRSVGGLFWMLSIDGISLQALLVLL